MNNRTDQYRKKWREITDIHGYLCYYCKKEIATTIDHVIPYSFDTDNEINNLVPSCNLCNILASDKHFDNVEQKRQYILLRRKRRKNSVAICTECLVPYSYRIHSPSLFLCAECYDLEYGTNKAKSKEWSGWIDQLFHAGIPIQAHRSLRRKLSKGYKHDHKSKMELIIDEYSIILSSDEKFAKILINR